MPVLPNGRTDFSKIPDDVSALVVQSPNFAGVIEDLEAAAKAAHDKGILLIASFSEAMAWGLLKNPGSCGADIVCGEGSRKKVKFLQMNKDKNILIRHKPSLNYLMIRNQKKF